MEEKRTYTLAEALQLVGNRLMEIPVPVSMLKQIGEPILDCAQIIGECLRSVMQQQKEEEQKQEKVSEIVPLEGDRA